MGVDTFKHYALIRANKRISILYLAWRNAVPVHAGIYFEMYRSGGAGESRKTSQVLHADDTERHIWKPAAEDRPDGRIPDNEYRSPYVFVAKYERFKIRIHAKERKVFTIENARDLDEPVPVCVAFQYGSDRDTLLLLLEHLEVVEERTLPDAYLDERRIGKTFLPQETQKFAREAEHMVQFSSCSKGRVKKPSNARRGEAGEETS